MKKFQEGKLTHLIPLLVATVALTLSACVSAEIEPPEIKALIGMKIPPAIEGKASGNIPDFVSVGSLPGVDFEDGFSFAFEEGLYANKWYVLIASRFFEWFRGEEIVAVLVLPEKLRNWEYRNGGLKGPGSIYSDSISHASQTSFI